MQFFFIHLKKKFIRIDIDEIRWALSVAHHIKLVTDQGVFIPHLSLKQLEEVLPAAIFTRVNRGTLVSLKRVISFDKEEVILRDARFSFSDKYRKEFESKVLILLHQETKDRKKDTESVGNIQTNVCLLSFLPKDNALNRWAA